MKSMNISPSRLAPLVLAAMTMLMMACASDPTADNIRFGESVRHMITLQTADPQRGAYGLEGEKAENILRSYRSDVAGPEAAEREPLELDF